MSQVKQLDIEALKAEQRILRQAYAEQGPRHHLVNRLEEIYTLLQAAESAGRD